MTSSGQFVEQLYRRIVSRIALWVLILDAATIVITSVTLLFSANVFVAVITGIALVSAAGCGLTLLLRQRPLWQMILPFVISIVGAETVIAIWLPELLLATLPFLSVAILLTSLLRQRSFTVSVLVLCIVFAFVVVITGQTEEDSRIPLQLLQFLRISSITALFIALWAFLDRILAAQMQALQIADQRAEEAEAARNTAETARQEIERRALEQQRLLELVAVLELPVLTIDERILLVPLVGHLDSRRAEALRQRVLKMVAERRAHAVIIDVTGITIIDTAVARALIDTATAIRLLGARTLISGIGPAVAQTLVHLNIGLEEIVTAPNPEAALRLARATVGV